MTAHLKLENDKGLCKIMSYPKSFDELIIEVKKFVPSSDNKKRYQLIDEKIGKEISTQEDFILMTNEYLNNKITPKIKINLVDNNAKYINPQHQQNKENMNIIANESIINISGVHKKEHIINNDSNPINGMIKKKLKELEDKLVDELFQNSMLEIEKSKMMSKVNPNEESVIKISYKHKDVICNKCGKEIIGDRFKCLQCQNFNLCENCEKNYNHDIRHIMIAITIPIEDEHEFVQKLNKNISYKNQNMNYDIEPKVFYLFTEPDIQSHEVTIKNNGLKNWDKVCLKCIADESEMVGDDCEINSVVNSGNEIKMNITFYNIKAQLCKDKNVYYSFFEMFNNDNESFGNITKIKIIFTKPN